MIGNKRFLAVVPARGGSKSVPRKNIRPLGGKPLLSHTLAQIATVPEIDVAVVSTDDVEIAAVARADGGRVVERPAELAGDTAPTEWALLHALDALAEKGEHFDYVMVLEPTSPFRSPATIRRCMERIVEADGKSLMTVVETRANIGSLEAGVFRPLVPGAPRRRQERKPFYIESSTVYVASVGYLRASGTLVCDDWLAVSVDERETVDINTPLDFEVAQALFRFKTG
jgi:CMP-N,N'-diacetyllegionaminic acid synthase